MKHLVVVLAVVVAVIVLSGCETIKGAGQGAGKDVRTLGNPDKNGYHAIMKADAWVQQALW
jgi:predicted small secreted protein